MAWKRAIRWTSTHRFIAAVVLGLSICAVAGWVGYFSSAGIAVFLTVVQILVLYGLFRAMWPAEDDSPA